MGLYLGHENRLRGWVFLTCEYLDVVNMFLQAASCYEVVSCYLSYTSGLKIGRLGSRIGSDLWWHFRGAGTSAEDPVTLIK